METYVTLINKSYDDLRSNLDGVSHKLYINTVKILQTPIVNLNGNVLNGFVNLIDLGLNHCSLMVLENGIFEPLSHLKSINLGFNLISSIANDLFRNNHELNRIILKSNVLVDVNQAAFSGLTHLETLDLSYNHISKLETEFLNCPHLKTLFLNNNEIQQIVSCAFNKLGYLTNLDLNSNKIQFVQNDLFMPSSKNVRVLNLSNNVIHKLGYDCFIELTELCNLNLSNNIITCSLITSFFWFNSKLTDLDLSGNQIYKITRNAFDNCPNLNCLTIGTCEYFEISSIKDLKALRKIQIAYRRRQAIRLNSKFWDYFNDKIELREIKLTFQELHTITLPSFSKMATLETLHIECKNPSTTRFQVNFYEHFNKMPKLKKIVFKNLNHLFVTGAVMEKNSMKHLDLTGIKNNKYDFIFKDFQCLEYLNLSFSGIEDINESIFKYLVNLKHLDLANTKIKKITSKTFVSNVKLRYLNFSNCQIGIVEDFSFQNLKNLLVLDFSPRSTFQRNENTFSGLSNHTLILR